MNTESIINYLKDLNGIEIVTKGNYQSELKKFSTFTLSELKKSYNISEIKDKEDYFAPLFQCIIDGNDMEEILKSLTETLPVIKKKDFDVKFLCDKISHSFRIEIRGSEAKLISSSFHGITIEDETSNSYIYSENKKDKYICAYNSYTCNNINSIMIFDKSFVENDILYIPVELLLCIDNNYNTKSIGFSHNIEIPLKVGPHIINHNIVAIISDPNEIKPLPDNQSRFMVYEKKDKSEQNVFLDIGDKSLVFMGDEYNLKYDKPISKELVDKLILEYSDKPIKLGVEGYVLYSCGDYMIRII